MTKRYLILLLLLMVSTAHADVSLGDVYLTLSDDEKKMHLNYCRLETFPDYFTNEFKKESCVFAAEYTIEKYYEEENIYKLDGLENEFIRYTVKACNFKFLAKKSPDVDRSCDDLIKRYYDLYKCPKPKIKDEAICKQLKEYKGFK